MRRIAARLIALSVAADRIGAEFDPYRLNGGLVAAVAGRDFVVLATDTRLTDGGYEILSRTHASSRLWSPWASESVPESEENPDAGRIGPGEGLGAAAAASSSSHSGDGSARIPPLGTSSRAYAARHPPVWIASSGCSTDCEQLKRLMRSHLRAATYFHPNRLEDIPGRRLSNDDDHQNVGSALPSATCAAPSVANLLSQVLYSRRGFPFYAFCVLAGMSDDETSGDRATSPRGHVCVYDAIGSYERVSVATAGTGREILQPILDRRFDSELTRSDATGIAAPSVEELSGSGDDLAHGVAQPRASAYGLQRQRAYPTHVTCTAPEAVEILRQAYEAVSEREISVGDLLLVCVVRKRRQNDENSEDLYETQFLTFPLKKH